MKIFKSTFSIIIICGFLYYMDIPLLGQMKSNAPARSYLGVKHGDDTLASIDGKVITVREFRERSEFTVRPQNFKNKYITLNNLIMEKILSLEAEQDEKSALNSGMQSMLDGIKEQQMRAQLYYEAAYNKVKLDPAELKKAYELSTREYELEFYRLPNKKFADRVDNAIHSSPAKSDSLFKEIEDILGKKPVHTTKFDDNDDDAIHKALYTNAIKSGTVIGPVRLSDGGYIVMKVLKWVDYPLISGEEQQARWNKVNDFVHLRKAEEQWRSFQANVMKGKRLTFDRHSFEMLSLWAMEKYMENKKEDSLNIHLAELEIKKPEIDLDKPFFTMDNRTWTLQDVREIIRTHPLVYRTTALDSTNFRQQFRLAIIDLMRDYYLTKSAYKRSLDKHENVKNTVKMWKDSFLASNKAKSIVDTGVGQGIVKRNDERGLSEFWNSHVITLQQKYGKSIWINHTLLDRIALTKIDMIALKPGFPYPLEVPQFPALMVSENLDYATLKK
jgi:hypothetical protein